MPIPNQTIKKMGFSFKNYADDNLTEMLIYDEISSYKSVDFRGIEGTEVIPQDIIDKLCSTTGDVVVRINSGGGDVFAACAIQTAIKEERQKGRKINCKIDGICASAAVAIALACEKISIPVNCYIMIHNPSNFLFGSYESKTLNKLADTLEVIKEGIIDGYVQRTGISAEECSKLMDETTWLKGKIAVEKGFADEVLFDKAIVEPPTDDVQNCQNIIFNGVQYDFSAFINAPKELLNSFENINSNKKPKGMTDVMEIKNAKDVQATYPEFVNEIVNSVVAEQIKNERERIKSLDALSGKVSNEAINKAKYETFENAEKVAFNALSTGDFVNNTFINALEKDAKKANEVGGTVPEEDEDEESQSEEAKKAKKAENLVSNALKKCNVIR